ncbi:MAG: ATP-binding protein [Myxococcota bacterium]|jgi:signal transduction histidine kinase|nr:ATP-binding protein [Myxococcota bacterium]
MVRSTKHRWTARDAQIIGRFHQLSEAILDLARRGVPLMSFLEGVSEHLMAFSGLEAVQWWLKEGPGYFQCRVARAQDGKLAIETESLETSPDGTVFSGTRDQMAMAKLYKDIIEGHFDPQSTSFTPAGSFWTNDARTQVGYRSPRTGGARKWRGLEAGGLHSLLLMPLVEGSRNAGFILLCSSQKDFFEAPDVDFHEIVAGTISVALANQKVQVKLRERVKELTCLYTVAHLSDQPGLGLDEILQCVVGLLPPAWQFTDIARSRIRLDGQEHVCGDFTEGPFCQRAEIVLNGVRRGEIEVFYLESRPPMGEGPFLEEERRLIDTLAREIAGVLERRAVRDEREQLEHQIRHADRLATIGQLAAGVAHELNEPLATILGFAQLLEKSSEIQASHRGDLRHIVEASLHARDIVRKLRLFARQTPAQRKLVDLNAVVRDGLYFVEARCAKQGVRILLDLSTEPVEVEADPGQLHQVLVNLTVNAMQAMQSGGDLVLRTRNRGNEVVFVVVDTGCGMSPQVREKIFLPFFTTKDVDQGTGLGLSVVHGIVAAHGGRIEVESAPQRGTRFEICLPREGRRIDEG